MSKTFSEWVTKRNEITETILNGEKKPTAEEMQAIADAAISSDTFMIVYELDRLCDILERKGR